MKMCHILLIQAVLDPNAQAADGVESNY